MDTDRPQTRTAEPLAKGRPRLRRKIRLLILPIIALPFIFHQLAVYYFSPERLAPLVGHALEQYLPRQVVWREMRFNPFTGLSFSGFGIGEHPDFGPGAFFSCKNLKLGLSLRDLAFGRIVINKISLTKPLITIRQDRQGRFNLADIALGIKETTAGETGSNKRPHRGEIDFNLKEIRIGNGLVLADLGSLGLTQRARDFCFKAIRRSKAGIFDWTLDLTVENIPARAKGVFSPNQGSGAMNLQAQNIPARALVRLLPRNAFFDLPRGRISLGLDLSIPQSGPAQFKGSLIAGRTSLILHRPNKILNDFQAGLEFDLAYHPQAKQLDLKKVSLALNRNQAEITGWIKPDGFEMAAGISLPDANLLNQCGLLTRPVMSGALDLDLHLRPDKEPGSVLAEGNFTGQGLGLESDREVVGPLNLRARFKTAFNPVKKNLHIQWGDLVLPGFQTTLSGNISPPAMALDFSGTRLDLALLKGLFPFLDHPFKRGEITSDFSLKGNPAKPKGWLMQGRAEMDQATLRFDFLDDPLVLSGPLEFKGAKATIPLLKGRLGSSLIELSGEADLFSAPGRAEFDLEMDCLDLSSFSTPTKGDAPREQSELDLFPAWSSLLSWNGRVKLGVLSHQGHTLEKVSLKYHLNQGRLLIAPFKAQLKPRGDLALNLTLSPERNHFGYQGQVVVSDTRLENLMGFLGLDQNDFPGGDLDMVAAFGGKGLGLPGLRSNLTAQITARIMDGRFPDNPVFNSMSRFLGLEFLKDCRFSAWQGNLELVRGSSNIQGRILNSEYSFAYQGRLDLDGLVDLKARLALAPLAAGESAMAEVIDQAARDGQGLYVLPLVIKGRGPATGVALDNDRLWQIKNEFEYGLVGGP